jgi:hypothetical protein
LEKHLALTCERITAGLRGLIPPRKLEAVLLGGGYGRGEGGVLRTDGGDRPYNDLEFYVCVRGNRHLNEARYGRALHVLGEILTPQAGIDVEFHITSLRNLATAGISMFSYDLLCGHRCCLGNETQLAGCEHHRDAHLIPLSEATRLLMNRCAGLLFAAERLARPDLTPADADFVARNIAKAQLGAGDAVLTAFHQYHWSVRERQRRLERLRVAETIPWMSELRRHHAEGVEFKLHPTRTADPKARLMERHQAVTEYCRVVWLWLEGRRLSADFRTLDSYLAIPRKHPSAGPRNVLVNAKAQGVSGLLSADAFRHPRERVLSTLPVLLWQPNRIHNPEASQRLRRELRTTSTDFSRLVAAFRDVWTKVN